jgi:cytochrome c peroxidase
MHGLKLAIIFVFLLFGGLIVFQRQDAVRASARNQSGSLSAPANVTATDGVYATKVGIYWDTVRHSTLYRIYRNTTNNSGSAVDVGTTAANYFFDSSAIAGQQYFYWVQSENSQGNSDLSDSEAGLRAVGNNSPGAPFPPLQPPPFPTGNPITATKAYLGKALFWEEQVSSTKTVACGTCHRPAEGGSDPRTNENTRHPGFDNTFGTLDDVFGSPGVPQNAANGAYSPAQFFDMGLQVTNRKSPSYLNAGYTTDGLFWDGRARDQFRDPITNNVLLSSFGGLESQAVFPPLAADEMSHVGRDWNAVVSRLQSSKPLALATEIPPGLTNWIDGRNYPELFEEAFGTPEITPARISMAIATHERTLFTDQTPLDRWSAQLEPLIAQEETGRQIFVNQNCTFCHGGALLSNASYQNVGVRPTTEDPGRGGITGIPDDLGRFKTPNLRNLELRGPFMHNGRFATVEDVVEFYNRGGDFDAPNIDTRIRPLNLTTQQKAALVAFLKRPLTDQRVANELPPFDRPQLYTESEFVPTITGTGRAGTGGIVPDAIAIEPPLVGNPSFAIAVSNGLAGQQAVLVIDSSDPGVGATIPANGSFARVATVLSGSGSDGYGTAVLSIPAANPSLNGQTFFGRWYVIDPSAINGFSVSRLIQFTVFGGTAAPGNEAPFDFDGDGKTDVAIFRPGSGEWWWNRSSDGVVNATQFGSQTDVVAPGDFTGDGKLDHAFFRPSDGFWNVLRSENFTYYGFPFGTSGDVPVTGDYDADGKADVAVFRPSTSIWYIARSSDGGTSFIQFGIAGDVPVNADYDGDGRQDIAIYRPNGANGGEWWINRSTAGLLSLQFGAATDKTVPADYTGDGKTDIAFWRPSTGEWYIIRSENFSFYAVPFGQNGDMPSPGDYDGDGKSDLAVFRPAQALWFIARSTNGGTDIFPFGLTGDRPVPNSFVR